MSEKCAGCFCHTHGDNSTASEINADLLAAAEGARYICRDYFENYLSIAVREEEGGTGFTCDACGCFSTNGEWHLDDCEAGEAMSIYKALAAAIKKAKGQ